ncbi:Hypothetical protein FKW44_023422 [Caligus rogercresseyi]|uniref:Uncharacterized protein n=1 Tax=Caligus rogercresseyi TaxID=217165 RepID=A0A7T8GNZ3_CALRO|nr:Hypothetical protein FKW44_023422 [Caligus rogercresseyi]
MLSSLASSNYRQYHMDNADICASPGKGQVLHLGTGASLFQLEEPSIRFQPNSHHLAAHCEIHLKAPKDYGFRVHVEKLRLRVKPNGGCVDYLQFGQEDNVPFTRLARAKDSVGKNRVRL